MKIRALTLMLGSDTVPPERIARMVILMRGIVSESDYKLISVRIALRPPEEGNLEGRFREAAYLSRLVDYIAVPLETPFDPDVVVGYMAEANNLFVSISDNVESYLTLLGTAVEKLGVEVSTRISLTINGPIHTPYFPSATAVEDVNGLMMALRYAEDIASLVEVGNVDINGLVKVYKLAYDLYKRLVGELRLKPLGIDYSLSPWMDESVAGVIEKFSGRTFGRIGTADAIRRLNEAIEAASENLDPGGFNEVMLPYAEDSRLMELGLSGEITAHKLALLAAACVSGVDMVPIPLEDLEEYVYEAYSILRPKSRPSGIRVIPVQVKPGDIVEIPRFGAVPVPPLE